eukprot:scaffold368_cov258-Pinguiococcus_pyrenoidosus.AAC.37
MAYLHETHLSRRRSGANGAREAVVWALGIQKNSSRNLAEECSIPVIGRIPMRGRRTEPQPRTESSKNEESNHYRSSKRRRTETSGTEAHKCAGLSAGDVRFVVAKARRRA